MSLTNSPSASSQATGTPVESATKSTTQRRQRNRGERPPPETAWAPAAQETSPLQSQKRKPVRSGPAPPPPQGTPQANGTEEDDDNRREEEEEEEDEEEDDEEEDDDGDTVNGQGVDRHPKTATAPGPTWTEEQEVVAGPTGPAAPERTWSASRHAAMTPQGAGWEDHAEAASVADDNNGTVRRRHPHHRHPPVMTSVLDSVPRQSSHGSVPGYPNHRQPQPRAPLQQQQREESWSGPPPAATRVPTGNPTRRRRRSQQPWPDQSGGGRDAGAASTIAGPARLLTRHVYEPEGQLTTCPADRRHFNGMLRAMAHIPLNKVALTLRDCLVLTANGIFEQSTLEAWTRPSGMGQNIKPPGCVAFLGGGDVPIFLNTRVSNGLRGWSPWFQKAVTVDDEVLMHTADTIPVFWLKNCRNGKYSGAITMMTKKLSRAMTARELVDAVTPRQNTDSQQSRSRLGSYPRQRGYTSRPPQPARRTHPVGRRAPAPRDWYEQPPGRQQQPAWTAGTDDQDLGGGQQGAPGYYHPAQARAQPLPPTASAPQQPSYSVAANTMPAALRTTPAKRRRPKKKRKLQTGAQVPEEEQQQGNGAKRQHHHHQGRSLQSTGDLAVTARESSTPSPATTTSANSAPPPPLVLPAKWFAKPT